MRRIKNLYLIQLFSSMSQKKVLKDMAGELGKYVARRRRRMLVRTEIERYCLPPRCHVNPLHSENQNHPAQAYLMRDCNSFLLENEIKINLKLNLNNDPPRQETIHQDKNVFTSLLFSSVDQVQGHISYVAFPEVLEKVLIANRDGGDSAAKP